MRSRPRPGAVLATFCCVGVALIGACGIQDLAVTPDDGGTFPADGPSTPDVGNPEPDAAPLPDAALPPEPDASIPDADVADACTPSNEVCDGKDNDCNGETDEGCSCAAGEVARCYTGPTSTIGVGTCVRGLSTCDATGTFGPCVGQIVPVAEVCDGKDNDCNGQTDEELGTTSCGRGICVNTVVNCVGGVPQMCTPKPSQPETCNGLDDDCNGVVDDGCECQNGANRECYTGAMATRGVGICRAGTETCAGGRWGACVGEIVPRAETCNLQDDDCDGQTDENLGTTVCGVGACSAQVQNCVAGVPQVCVAGAPSPELCDNVDNDCDGNIDENNPGGGLVCATMNPGVCAPGTTSCTDGALRCNSNIQSSPEICDGKDNDCDGATDEDNPGAGVACNTNKLGLCKPGLTACTGGAIVCNQTVFPVAEICDEKDNDCDGDIDEDDVCPP